MASQSVFYDERVVSGDFDQRFDETGFLVSPEREIADGGGEAGAMRNPLLRGNLAGADSGDHAFEILGRGVARAVERHGAARPGVR